MRLRTAPPPLRTALAAALAGLSVPMTAHAQGTAPWQQRVAYEMDVTMDAPAHRMAGRQRLTLQNNAPDTLRQVFYHLYFNAFQKTSLMATRNRHLPDPDARVVPRIFEYTPDEEGWHRIGSLTQDGQPVPFRVDDTVLRADLVRPIPPGGRAVFEMQFTSQVPLQTRRSGWKSREGIDFSMSQWYPKLAHYDTRGWHADPYIGREFYAPFGTWDVRITLPSEYTVGGTGVVVNAEAVGKGYQRDTSRVVAHPPGSNLTWHFRAENVHDFAWVADRDYVHDRIDGPNGRQYHLLYQPNVATGWRFLRGYVPALFEVFERKLGPYVWPQFTVAQAGDGGMEYPMINFITGGRTPGSLVGVTAHEAAHEWFYGMLGSNESDYAWMDEGFTEFATTEALTALFQQNAPAARADHRSATKGIVALQESGLFEPVSFPSDWYASNRAYSTASYGGGQMILDLLGYVLGDSVRDAGLRRYVQQYTLRHPQPADVERTMEAASGVQLDWFFQQVAHSTRRLDLAVGSVRRRADSTHVTLERKGDMFFPVDVRLTMGDGSTRFVHVPTSEMVGAKAVPAGWTVARPWGWTHERYTFAVPGRVRTVQLDPERRSPDYNRLNDADRFPVRRRFLEAPVANEAHYSLGWRPLVTYADDYGVGVGVRTAGTYWLNRLNYKGTLTLFPEVLFSGGDDPTVDEPFSGGGVGESIFGGAVKRSWLEGIDYAYRLESRLPWTTPQTRFEFTADKHLGVLENRLALRHTFGRFAALGHTRGTLTGYLRQQRQPWDRGFGAFSGADEGRGFGDELPVFLRTHVLSGGLRYEARGRGASASGVRLEAEVGSSVARRSTFLGSVSANRFTLDATKQLGRAGKARLFLGLGDDRLAFHKRFRLGQATFEDVWRNAASRTAYGVAERVWELPFGAFSGVGPVGYFNPRRVTLPGGTLTATRLLAGSLEANLPQPLPGGLTLGVFSGAAVPWGASGFSSEAGPFTFDNLLADAGVQAGLDVGALPLLRRWTPQSDVLQSLKLTAKFPFYVHQTSGFGFGDGELAFRYLFGLQVGM